MACKIPDGVYYLMKRGNLINKLLYDNNICLRVNHQPIAVVNITAKICKPLSNGRYICFKRKGGINHVKNDNYVTSKL